MQTHKGIEDFSLSTQEDWADQINTFIHDARMSGGLIAGISLLVGGIGIMNIMLVSVTERTKEIGLRQAVGAKTKDILAQFLVEAVTLSVAGGAIGIVLGVAASLLISYFAHWSTLLGVGSIALAFFFSALVGVSFGYYPARKAAYMDPIDALHYE
jgi:putative ABC transport system permease protein